MPGSDSFLIRSASEIDRSALSELLDQECFIHKHLDWTSPLERIGEKPFLLAESAGEVIAALACPPNPSGIAWLKLFTCSGHAQPKKYWDVLWERAQSDLDPLAGFKVVVAMPYQDWFERILISSGFSILQEVILFEWASRQPSVIQIAGVVIRPVDPNDLDEIVEIDQVAFEPVWVNSHTALDRAIRVADYSTVILVDQRVVGYQISTKAPNGGHLARLAILPGFQSRGLGRALVLDMQDYFFRSGSQKVTVNTQNDNQASIALYQKAGFWRTGKKYPVYQFLGR
jgi:ribosomal protein S18 acetylase RimI-like enzyme